MTIIDGNQTAQAVLTELQEQSAQWTGPRPSIAFVRVGDDPASVFYVGKKQKIAARLGFESRLQVFPSEISREDFFAHLRQLNDDPAVHGILVQSPLPPQLPEQEVFNFVAPEKDVDGLGRISAGRLVQEDPDGFAPCTPSGVVELLHRYDITTAGKEVVIIGRSLLVGKPMALLLAKRHPMGNATVTLAHSRTADLPVVTRRADILIAAIGRAHFLTAEMVKEGAVVIDVGINRVDAPGTKKGYRIVGDVAYDEVSPRCSAITPVPGGVGPMTVAMLMVNTWRACQQQSA